MTSRGRLTAVASKPRQNRTRNKSQLFRRLRRWRHNVVIFVRRPRRVTCLECGFLAWDSKEVDTPTRITLYNPGLAGQPAEFEKFHCLRSMWTWSLTYVDTDASIVRDELQQSRRGCDGYYRYRQGWSPGEHRDLVLKSSENRFRVWQVILSAAVGGAVALIVNRLTKWGCPGSC